MKIKKALAIVCIVCCMFSLTVPAFAANVRPETGIISVQMVNIQNASNHLSIKNGKASINAYVLGYSSTATKCEIEVKLQVKSGLLWKTVETWNDSQSGRSAAINETISITSGKSYRSVADITVWNGTKSESKTLTSGVIKA